MNKWQIVGLVAVSMILGAAYGANIPGIKQAAKVLPKSNVL